MQQFRREGSHIERWFKYMDSSSVTWREKSKGNRGIPCVPQWWGNPLPAPVHPLAPSLSSGPRLCASKSWAALMPFCSDSGSESAGWALRWAGGREHCHRWQVTGVSNSSDCVTHLVRMFHEHLPSYWWLPPFLFTILQATFPPFTITQNPHKERACMEKWHWILL